MTTSPAPSPAPAPAPAPTPAPGPAPAGVHRTVSNTTASSSFSSLRDKVVRALSPNRASTLGDGESTVAGRGGAGRRTSFGATMSFAEDRGRQAHVVSTGRGGAGNLVPHADDDEAVTPGAERGRELSAHSAGEVITHSGRGGAGNIRPSSHSRTRTPKETESDAQEEALQEKLVADSRGRQADAAFSTGRGGVGNISRSRSRSAAGREGRKESRREGSQLGRREGSVHASGRGGFGNISEEKNSVDLDKEAEREKYEASVLAKHNADEAAHPHAHATGKGGAGNLHVPGPDDHPDVAGLSLEDREAFAKVHAADKNHWVNTGRGGAGNMVHRKDQSPGSGDERGRDAHKGGMLGSVFRSISRAAGRDKSSDGRAKD